MYRTVGYVVVTVCSLFTRASGGVAQEVSKAPSQENSVKILRVAEDTRLNTIAKSLIEAPTGSRFVIIGVEFKPSTEPVTAADFLLLGSLGQKFECAGLGDGRDTGRYCMDPKLELTRRVWQNDQYFDGGCAERSGGMLAYDTFSTNQPVAVFAVPNTVALSGLLLQYKGSSLKLEGKKQ